MNCLKCKQEIDNTPFCPLCGAKQERSKRNNKKRGNGQGTARKRGNYWQSEVTFYVNGNRITRTKSGFRTKKEALEYCKILSNNTDAPLKVSELYNMWSKKHYANISDKKSKDYERAWNRLVNIAHKKITDVRYDELQSIIDGLSGYYSKKELRTVLHGIYTFAKKINQSITDLSELLDIGTKPEPTKQAFTKEQVQMMWDHVNEIPFLKYPLVMIYTGMRPGELFNVTYDMIEFDKNQIIGAGIKTKKGRNTPIAFPNKIKDLLKDYESITDKTRWQFVEEYKIALEQAGIDYLPPNCCRHTTATVLAELNVSPAIVKEIMRHTNAKTAIENYTHISAETKIQTLEQL